MRFVRLPLVLPLALTFTAHAQSRRDIADPVCGPIYPRGEGSACGTPTLFAQARTSACGPETFVQKKDKSCPGYVPHDVVSLSEPSGTSLGGCNRAPGGNFREQSNRVEETGEWTETNKPTRIKVRIFTCVRDEVIQSCRKPAFGVATWKSCRSPSHAPERYPACESSAFGPAIGYKVCSLVASTDEVASFLREMDSQLPQTKGLYAANTTAVVTLSNSADTLSCFIRKWENDVTTVDAVMDLKAKFASITGRAYDGVSPIDCTNIVSAVESAPACTDDSPLCVAQSSRLAARSWLEQKRDYALAIRDDLVAVQNAQTRAAIESSLAQITEALAK